MPHFLARARGRVLLARGRCPACASEAPQGCPVCLGHYGPFPPDSRSLRRWAHRFDETMAGRPPSSVARPASGDWAGARPPTSIGAR